MKYTKYALAERLRVSLEDLIETTDMESFTIVFEEIDMEKASLVLNFPTDLGIHGLSQVFHEQYSQYGITCTLKQALFEYTSKKDWNEVYMQIDEKVPRIGIILK